MDSRAYPYPLYVHKNEEWLLDTIDKQEEGVV